MPEPQLPAEQARLFTPGRRIGWIFRDPRLLAEPFTEPEPQPRPVPQYLFQQQDQAQAAHKRQVALAVKICGTIAGIFLAMGGCTTLIGGPTGNIAALPLFVIGVLAAIPGIIMIAVSRHRKQSASRELEEAKRFHAAEHEHAHAAWQRRQAEHQRAQADRLARAAEWGSAHPPESARRLDVIGGSLWGWEALLTVHGASLLSGQPVYVVDFSREVVCGELAALAGQTGIIVRTELLPTQLAESSLAAQLTPAQLVDALVESMHGGLDAPTGRADRSLDHRLLSQLAHALNGNVTIGRLVAGLRIMMGESSADPRLTDGEIFHIGEEQFTKAYLEQSREPLHRIESYLHPLQDLGARRTPSKTPFLTCIALEGSGRNPGSELLTDLIVQDLTHRIAATRGRFAPALIVAGADELSRDHLERLSDACERRHVPLTLLFRHLRESSLQLIGGGAVAFMRLGNHTEASAAADFIGRHHKFVLSTMTKTLGGNETHTTSTSEGHAETEGTSSERSFTRTSTYDDGFIPNLLNFSRASTLSTGHSRSTTRNWSTAKSFADGSNWSEATAQQRVYEYAVEPAVLQNLPDYALLLAQPVASGQAGAGSETKVTPADCNPAIVTLPKVSLDPLPAIPSHAPAQQQIPAAQPRTPEPWEGHRISGQQRPQQWPEPPR